MVKEQRQLLLLCTMVTEASPAGCAPGSLTHTSPHCSPSSISAFVVFWGVGGGGGVCGNQGLRRLHRFHFSQDQGHQFLVLLILSSHQSCFQLPLSAPPSVCPAHQAACNRGVHSLLSLFFLPIAINAVKAKACSLFCKTAENIPKNYHITWGFLEQAASEKETGLRGFNTAASSLRAPRQGHVTLLSISLSCAL